MKKNQESFCPLFSGFYNSMWELETDYITDDNGDVVPFDRLIINYEDWKKDCCEHIISELNDRLSDFSLNMRFQSIHSPKFYNFSTDSCNVIMDIDDKAVAKYIYENQSAFEDYLREKYTSYDGFSSSFSNRFEDWEEDTKKFRNYSESTHYLGAIISFICDNEDITELSIRDVFDAREYNYVDIIPLTWDDIDIDDAFEERIAEMDLEYGDIIFDVNDAKSRAELFSTDWKDELSDEVKIKLLEAAGIEADEFEYLKS